MDIVHACFRPMISCNGVESMVHKKVIFHERVHKNYLQNYSHLTSVFNVYDRICIPMLTVMCVLM